MLTTAADREMHFRIRLASISYGVNVDGEFISLLTFQRGNFGFLLPSQAIRALGDE